MSEAGRKPSLRFTVKVPPSKLRHALHDDDDDDTSMHDASDAEAPVRTARSTRNARRVVEPDSDDDIEASPELDDDDDNDNDDEQDDEEPDEDEDAEGDDDEDDEEQQPTKIPHPKSPASSIIQPSSFQTANVQKSKPKKPIKSVEEREEELEGSMSDLASDEPDDAGIDDEDEDEDIDMDDADDAQSRDATPDFSKMTQRQRAAHDEAAGDGLLALSNEALIKKHLTAEEHAMRRLEMARRRKTLSEKKNEEEKLETINKLLCKPSAKRKTRAEIMAAESDAADADGQSRPPNPLFVRWVNNAQGSRIGVPREWLESSVTNTVLGKGWQPPPTPPQIQLVEEIA